MSGKKISLQLGPPKARRIDGYLIAQRTKSIIEDRDYCG